MSDCLPEQTYAFYVDGELERGQVREVDSHLIQCQRCRALILALEDESALLSDLLLQRAPARAEPVPARQRARGLALGLAPTLAVGLLIVSVGGWILEQRLPGLSWWNPRNLIGVYEMAFDTIFTLRDTLPVLFDLALAIGATVSIAAVLTFLMGALLRRMTGTTAAVLLALLPVLLSGLAASESAALELRWDEKSVDVPRGEVLDDTLVASAEVIEIDGTVRGDLVALAERVVIRGRVEGNVFSAGREVLVTGTVDGSLHMACERCSLEGAVSGNLYSAAQDVTINEGARVGRDAHVVAAFVRADGDTGRDLTAGAEWVELRGSVGRTMRSYSERISVFDEARIGGDLLMEVAEHGESDVSDEAHIGGEVVESQLQRHHESRRNRWLDGGFYMRVLVLLASAFFVGLLLHTVVPRLFGGTLVSTGDFGRCLGYGFVGLLITPFVLFLLAISVVGIPIAVLGGFTYLTLIFVSTIVVASLVGSSITGSDPESSEGFGVALLLGLALVAVLANLPFVGGLLRVLFVLAGMGLVITTTLELWRGRDRGYL